jgi:hypothetical protein
VWGGQGPYKECRATVNDDIFVKCTPQYISVINVRYGCYWGPHFTLCSLPVSGMTCCCLSCRWGEVMSLNCGHQRAYCLSPWWYMNMENNGEMILTEETEELGENPVPVPLCPLKIQYELTRARIRVSVARGRRLTAWATIRPNFSVTIKVKFLLNVSSIFGHGTILSWKNFRIF